MKFRTTLVLLLLAAVATALVYYTRTHGGLGVASDQASQNTGTAEHPQKLFDFSSGEIAKITIKPAVGKPFALERQGLGWHLTEPVPAPADAMKVNDLAEVLVNLSSSGQVSASETASTGIDPPRYVVEMTDRAGKTTTLAVGDRTGVGSGDYVRVGGQDVVQITSNSTPDLLESLNKPTSSYRQARLLELAAPDVHALRIEHGNKILALARSGTAWQITAPITMAAEESAVSDLVFALTGMTATGFKGENAADAIAGTGPDAPFYRLDKPVLTVTLVSQPPAIEPTTKPTTRPDITTTVRFGGYSDVTQKDVYVAVSGSPSVATVPATILESFNKTPLDLRDLKVMSVDPAAVQSISVQTLPSPSGKGDTVTIERYQAPPILAKQKGATSAPATQPVTRWVIAGKKGAPAKAADDQRVDQLLTAFNPLHVVRYMEPTKWPAAPTTQPGSGRYIVHITLTPAASVLIKPAAPAPSDLRVLDAGPDQQVRAQYNDLQFELSRDMLEQLKSDYSAGAKPPQGADVPDLTPSSISR